MRIGDLYDLKTRVKALVSGVLLDEGMHEEQMKTVEMSKGSRYGLGIADMGGFWGHNGSLFGFDSIMLYNPDREATFVVPCSRSTGESEEATEIGVSLIKAVYPNQGKK